MTGTAQMPGVGAGAGAARIDVRRAIGATGDADFAPSVQGRGLASRRYYGSTLEYPALRQCSHAPARCCSAHSACSCCALAPRWAISSSASTPPAPARAPVGACVRPCVCACVRACVYACVTLSVCVQAHNLTSERACACERGACIAAHARTCCDDRAVRARRRLDKPREQRRSARLRSPASPVPAQMWAWDKPSLSRCRCGHGVSPGPAVGAGVRRPAILPWRLRRRSHRSQAPKGRDGVQRLLPMLIIGYYRCQ